MTASCCSLTLEAVLGTCFLRAAERRFEALGELRIAGDENRDAVHERHPSLERALRVETGGPLRTDREIVEEHLGTRFPEGENDLLSGRFGRIRGQEGAGIGVLLHMLGNAV